MIVIDPGHGGERPAGRSTPWGRRCAGGALEKDITLELGRQVARRLGGRAVMTRSADVNRSLLERTSFARAHGADAFVSLHTHAPRIGRPHAFASVMVHPHAAASSRALAFAVRDELCGSYGHRVLVERAVPLAVLHPGRLGERVAGIQVELDFDPGRYGSAGGLDALGSAIARGIARYGQAAAASFVDPAKVSCHSMDRSFPIFTAMGTSDPAGVLEVNARRAVELLDVAIGELTQARDRIAAGEPPAFPVLSDAVAWSLQHRMLMRVDDAAAWTGSGPRTAEQIMRWMRNIRDVIAGRQLHYTCIASANCDDDTWAWVIYGEYRVNLCRRFWNARAGLSAAAHADFQALTLVHEVSHIYYDTEDSGRGPGAAECIAQLVADIGNVALDRDFLGVCGPQGPSEVQSASFGRGSPAYSFALALQSPRFQGDPVLEQVSDGHASLRQGSRGDAVRKLQEALRDLGYTVGPDGEFGPQTARAVRAFQQAEGLGVDGVVGRGTLGALDARFVGAAGAAAVRVRRNITALSAAELTALAVAINALKSSGTYHNFIRDHANSMMTAHRQPAFTVWHRAFILNYESELRAIDSSITLPYWDWANDPGVVAGVPMWNSAMVALLGGDGDPNNADTVTTGPFSAWTMADSSGASTSQPLQRKFGGEPWATSLPRQAEINAVLGHTPYDAAPWDDGTATAGFRNDLEGWAVSNHLHNVVHGWVGGAMLPGTSPNDPVFFLHHAMIDKIFADWQAANPGVPYLPSSGIARPGGAPVIGFNDAMLVANVTSGSPFTVTPNDMWDPNNLRDHLGNTGIQVRYA